MDSLAKHLALPVAVVAAATLAVPATAQPAKASIEQVERHLAATRSLTASFTQTDGKNRSISGDLSLKRPGKVRFDYGANANMLLVGDGTNLHFLDYEVGQKSSWEIANSPLSVLLDSKPDLGRIARIVPSRDDRVVIVRARDARRPEFGTLILAFTKNGAYPGGLRLEGWTAIDAQNKRTAVTLRNQRYNVAIPDSKFRYRDPT
ncbi:LolA family protein [Sphingomicrobium astaxanthinifaciens]|uniref:LolA family protein n=1 Tax=Sphingomicrobium astaxanthinifaciens TaxID=1227949 RepID=UPI001FCCA241|nr:outer membrane lipoprotein carrier protein LolA [Sphingomicrobium astaxanthinifaciens]MCJ7421191.1 outer membrane lipoprotein carrier protein LolA [Sphingomicrobium astaxanthinifaciens]